jgi:anti-sigma-I factor rsgI
MKAVVLEIKEKWAAVLCEDGVIRKVKKGNFKVGDSFDFEAENHKKVVSIGSLRRNMVGSAAALFLIVAGVAGTYSYNNVLACSYVSLDINPSIEYTLNRQDKVVAVKGLNNDGQKIADELLSVRKVTLKEALQETKQLLTKKNYLKSGSSEDVLIDISANNSARKDTLKKEALSVFDTEQTKGELNLVLTESDLKEHKRANSLGISTGEYKQIQYIKNKSEKVGDNQYNDYVLQASDIAIYKDYTVSQLLESSGQGKKNTQNDTSDNKAESQPVEQSTTALKEEQNGEKQIEQPTKNSNIEDESTGVQTEKPSDEKESKAVKEPSKNPDSLQTVEEAPTQIETNTDKTAENNDISVQDTERNSIKSYDESSKEQENLPQQNNNIKDNGMKNEGGNQGDARNR